MPGFKGRLVRYLGSTLLTMSVVSSAHAIVSTTSPSNWLGSGVSALDGMAKLILTRSDGTYICSGSLVAGGEYILTAGHCVTGGSATATTSSVSVSFLGGSVTASSNTYYVDPTWNGNLSAGNDLALIKLSSTITSITGYTLDYSSALGNTVLLSGYGNTGTGSTGYVNGTYGTLHYGYNQYDYFFPSAIYYYDFDGNGNNLFGTSGLGTSEALIAPGDSGGGTLVNVGGIWQLAGVHSFIGCNTLNCTPNSSFGQYAGDVSIAANSAWLLSYLDTVMSAAEPGSVALLIAALGMTGIRRRSRPPRTT